jgi:hypothetical protein
MTEWSPQSEPKLRDVGPQASAALPPSWFRTTSTVSSSSRLASLLHLAASRGSTRFRTDRPGRAPQAAALPGPTGTIPASQFTPLEEFPSSTAVPHHCGRCLLDVDPHPHARERGRRKRHLQLTRLRSEDLHVVSRIDTSIRSANRGSRGRRSAERGGKPPCASRARPRGSAFSLRSSATEVASPLARTKSRLRGVAPPMSP